MSPLRFKVVVPQPMGDTTRDPEPTELEPIQAYVRAFVERTGKEPLGAHDVEGLGAVRSMTIHN